MNRAYRVLAMGLQCEILMIILTTAHSYMAVTPGWMSMAASIMAGCCIGQFLVWWHLKMLDT